MYIYTYIYIYIHIYMYTCICTYTDRYHSEPFGAAARATRRERASRRRQNMVGVNMVLAEFIQFKHGL